MDSILQVVFSYSGNEISLLELIVSGLIVITAVFMILYLKRLLLVLSNKDTINPSQRALMFKSSVWIIVIITLLLVMLTLGIQVQNFWRNIQNIFDYHLFGSGEREVKVYNVVLAVMVILAAWILLRWVRRILAVARHRKRLTVGQEFAYLQVTRYVVILIVIALVLFIFHVKITALVVGSAGLLLGIGLGLQQIFIDFVSGFFLLMEHSVRVNDIIEISNFVCKVKEIGVRTSKVVTRDGIIVVVPNSKIISDSVINWSMNGTTTRFVIPVGVAYGSDTQKVKKILLSCASRHQEVSKHPKPICRFTDFGNSALQFELLFWSKSRFRIEDVKSDLRFMIDSEFNKNGVRIPFPQRDIHIRSNLTRPPQTDQNEDFVE